MLLLGPPMAVGTLELWYAFSSTETDILLAADDEKRFLKKDEPLRMTFPALGPSGCIGVAVGRLADDGVIDTGVDRRRSDLLKLRSPAPPVPPLCPASRPPFPLPLPRSK